MVVAIEVVGINASGSICNEAGSGVSNNQSIDAWSESESMRRIDCREWTTIDMRGAR